jgi:ERCC4-type nuclease
MQNLLVHVAWSSLSETCDVMHEVKKPCQRERDISDNCCHHSTQSGDTMPNQQFHFCSKILITGASGFWYALRFDLCIYFGLF